MKRLVTVVIGIALVACQPENQTNSPNASQEKEVLAAKLSTSNEKKNSLPDKGTEENPLVFYFTPSVAENVISENAMDMIRFLEKETGYSFRLVIPENYDIMIEDFGADQVDLAIMNSFGYLIAHEKYGVKAKLRSLRYGKSTYQGQIITHVENGIEDINDLQGKSFAFTDSSSTSGFLFPNHMISVENVELAQANFVVHHDEVVRQVYQKKVHAGATFYSAPGDDGSIRDARSSLLKNYPDIGEKVKIIALTEPIPNDPVVFRKSIPEALSNKLLFAIMKYSFTDEGKKALGNLYGTEGFVRCSDQDYDNMQDVISKSGISLGAFL